MIIKILKGRSFGGLLDYLFDDQKPPPPEIDARGAPGGQGAKEKQLPDERAGSETARTGPVKSREPEGRAEERQSGDTCGTRNTKRGQRGEIIVTNMAGRTKEELREHFEALAALRPDVEVNVLHAILGLPEDDALSRATEMRLVRRFAKLAGLDRSMYAAVKHQEEGHRHKEIHLISSTIDFKRRLPSDSFDYHKGEIIARQLEKEFDLKPTRPSRDSMSRAPTQGEWKQHERTGKLSRPLRLQALVDSALDHEVTFTDFKERLKRRGVELNLIVTDSDKVVGSIYKFEGKHIRGRRLGRGYTWHGLQQTWPNQHERKGRMKYEPERDYAAFSRSRSSAVGRGRGTDESREPAGFIGTISEDRGAHGRAEREAGAYRKSSGQDHSVGEKGRGAVRHDRTRWKGTARRDRAAQEGLDSRSQQVQRAGERGSEQRQRGVPVPTGNSSDILQQGPRDKRQERKDGDSVSGNGGDEQRHLQQGQRRSTGSLREDANASQVSSRRASQRDRGAGSALQDGLQETNQINRHRDNSNSRERLNDRCDGRRNVATNGATAERGKQSLDSTDAKAKENSNAPLRPQQDAQATDSKSNDTSLTSAVDQIIQKLWSDSSGDNIPAHLGTIGNHKDSAKRKENKSKGLDAAIIEGISKREEALGNRTSPEVGKDKADPSPSQKLSQEKQMKHTERSRTSGGGRGR